MKQRDWPGSRPTYEDLGLIYDPSPTPPTPVPEVRRQKDGGDHARWYAYVDGRLVEALAPVKSGTTVKLAVFIQSQFAMKNGEPFKIGNIWAARLGISPDAKIRGLLELAGLGLIEVEIIERRAATVRAIGDFWTPTRKMQRP